MSNYQQMIEDLTESYVAVLDKNQDEQGWVENEVMNRLKSAALGINFNDVRGSLDVVIRKSFSQEVSGLREGRDPIYAYFCSPAVEEFLSGIQYDLMRHCVILERALALSAAANPTYERLSTGEWVS